MGLIRELGRSLGEGNGNSLQYSCLGNPMDRGAWRATVHGVTNSRTWLKQVNNNNRADRLQVLVSYHGNLNVNTPHQPCGHYDYCPRPRLPNRPSADHHHMLCARHFLFPVCSCAVCLILQMRKLRLERLSTLPRVSQMMNGKIESFSKFMTWLLNPHFPTTAEWCHFPGVGANITLWWPSCLY